MAVRVKIGLVLPSRGELRRRESINLLAAHAARTHWSTDRDPLMQAGTGQGAATG